MITSILLSALAVTGFVVWQRRDQRVTAQSPQQTFQHPSISRAVTLPKPAAPKFLRLVADPNCSATRAIAGRVVAAAQALSLQAVGCRPGQCSCHYVPTSDRRRGLRRDDADRRDNLRFGRDCNRRLALDRRDGGLWDIRTRN